MASTDVYKWCPVLQDGITVPLHHTNIEEISVKFSTRLHFCSEEALRVADFKNVIEYLHDEIRRRESASCKTVRRENETQRR